MNFLLYFLKNVSIEGQVSITISSKILTSERKIVPSYDEPLRKLFMIDKIIDEVNGTRKRMISINFILRKVLSMMNLPFDDIPISK